MTTDAQPDQVIASYSMARFSLGAKLSELEGLDHLTTVGIMEILLGAVPPSLSQGGEIGEEWKLHVGGEHWVIVTRVR